MEKKKADEADVGWRESPPVANEIANVSAARSNAGVPAPGSGEATATAPATSNSACTAGSSEEAPVRLAPSTIPVQPFKPTFQVRSVTPAQGDVDQVDPEGTEDSLSAVAEDDEEAVALQDPGGTGIAASDLPDADVDPTVDPAREGDIEARAEQVRDFVEALLNKMGMKATAELLEPEPDDPPTEVRIEIEGPDSGRIIGKKGQVLAAIQHIVNRIANRPNLERLHVIVDAEGYRQRREDILASMAQRLGKRALEEGKIITFEPMSPRDRRIVHLALAKFPGVVTKSDGEGEGRRVQIIPVRR